MIDYLLTITAFGAIVFAACMTIYAMLNAQAANRAEEVANQATAAAEYQKRQADRWRADALTLRARHGYNTDFEVMP